MDKTIPCKTCTQPTAMMGTKLCHGCWEVEHRLEDYLRCLKGRLFVKVALDKAEAAERFKIGNLNEYCDLPSRGY